MCGGGGRVFWGGGGGGGGRGLKKERNDGLGGEKRGTVPLLSGKNIFSHRLGI